MGAKIGLLKIRAFEIWFTSPDKANLKTASSTPRHKMATIAHAT